MIFVTVPFLYVLLLSFVPLILLVVSLLYGFIALKNGKVKKDVFPASITDNGAYSLTENEKAGFVSIFVKDNVITLVKKPEVKKVNFAVIEFKGQKKRLTRYFVLTEDKAVVVKKGFALRVVVTKVDGTRLKDCGFSNFNVPAVIVHSLLTGLFVVVLVNFFGSFIACLNGSYENKGILYSQLADSGLGLVIVPITFGLDYLFSLLGTTVKGRKE